jgi:diguanylate cyclase (GGDEF)-like protein
MGEDRGDDAAARPAVEPPRVGARDVSIAPLPANEAARLRTLGEYRILDTGRDARFEELVAEIARSCDAPIATITFVDATRQWFKAAVGISYEQTERDVAFCAHTILEPDDVLVIEDATRDERFANNPLVVGDPHLMAYAGAPMVAPDGTVIGTVCAMDYEPRPYTREQLSVLRRVAAQVVELLDVTSAAERLLAGEVDRSSTLSQVDLVGDDGWDGREGSADDVLELTRPLIEAIGEAVDVVAVLESFCTELIRTFGWWAVRIAWVHGDGLRPDPWLLAPGAPPVLEQLALAAPGPTPVDDLGVDYRDPAVHDVGMLRWLAERDLVAGVGGRHAVVLDVPGATLLAARLTFLLPSARALTVGAVRTLTTAAAVLPRVFVQDRARRELTYRATHDMLTGLINREGLAQRYHDVVGDRTTHRALLFIDLDGFKAINDSLGHRAGDEILVHVARQLAGRIRPTDTAVRLGGDEFLVVLDWILHEEEALRVARRLLRALCGSHTLFHTQQVDIMVSIGVALWGEGLGLDAAIDVADRLMYAAKELGGAAIAVDGSKGRRLIGVNDGDERDLDAVLAGAIQVAVARVRGLDGRFRAVRAALNAEVRRPSVREMAEILLEGVRPLLDEATPAAPVELILVPAGMLWATDGLVLRLLVEVAASLPDVPLRLVLTAEDGQDSVVRQALMARDALGVGLIVGAFGSLDSGLGLVDRVAPIALELADDVLARRSDLGPSSAQLAAQALARRRGLTLIAAAVSESEASLLVGDLLDDGVGDVLVVDASAVVVHRRELPPRPEGRPMVSARAEDT